MSLFKKRSSKKTRVEWENGHEDTHPDEGFELGDASVKAPGGAYPAEQPPSARRRSAPTQVSYGPKGRTFLLWTLLVTVLILWAFVVGVLIGQGTFFRRQTYNELEQRLAAERSSSGQTAQPSTSGTQTGTQTETPSGTQSGTQSETQTGTQTTSPPVTKKPTKPQTLAREIQEAVQSVEKDIVEVLDPSKVEPPLEQKPEPAPEPEPEPQPAPKPAEPPKPPPPAHGENFTVQVAATATAAEAEESVKELKNKGFDAYYYHVSIRGRSYFRVRVGRYQTRKEAQETVDKLHTDGYRDMFISELQY